jgi:hypothetical protein
MDYIRGIFKIVWSYFEHKNGTIEKFPSNTSEF